MISSCTACPTEENAVQNLDSDSEDTCEKCTGARNGGAEPYYCTYCPSGIVCGDKCCGDGEMCQNNGPQYSYTYTCISELEEGECLTNADCNNGSETGEYYCQNDFGCQATVGTCQPISSTTVTLDNEKKYTASTNDMSYHASENFCRALGKSLVTLEENCTAEELATIKANGYYNGNCTGWVASSGNYGIYWTSTKVDGCTSHYVSPRSSLYNVGGGVCWDFTNNVNYALCR